MPKFDENGALIDGNGYSDVTEYREVASGGASVQVLKNWVPTDGGGLRDPVIGTVASQLSLRSSPTTLTSIADLGRPEQLSLVSALGLEEELVRADLVAAAKRTADGLVFYDFDLALPAAKCDGTMATACLPSLVVLLSAAVRDGKLHMLRVDAGPDEWCAPTPPPAAKPAHPLGPRSMRRLIPIMGSVRTLCTPPHNHPATLPYPGTMRRLIPMREYAAGFVTTRC